jgi:hypothetical protein
MSRNEKGDKNNKPDASVVDGNYRNYLAVGITAVSILGVIALAITAIMASPADERMNSVQLVLTGVLPLLGVWVGTVLAYYFSKENFEAATRSVSDMTRRLTGEEALAEIVAEDVMLKIDKMKIFKLPATDLVLTTMLDDLENTGKGSRFPILSASGQPKYSIHRSVIDRYLAEKARAGTTRVDIEKLSLQHFFDDDPKRETRFGNSFATMKADDTLAVAKHRMDQDPGIQDIFVTKNGKTDGEVIGWITNVLVAEHSKVAGALQR